MTLRTAWELFVRAFLVAGAIMLVAGLLERLELATVPQWVQLAFWALIFAPMAIGYLRRVAEAGRPGAGA